MADDGHQVAVAHLVQRVALGKSVRLGHKIVVIGDPLGRGFRIVAARAVPTIKLATSSLLVTKGDLLQLQFDEFARVVAGRCGELVSASNATQRDHGTHLAAGIGQRGGWIEEHARGTPELHCCARDRVALRIVYLHDHRLLERRAGLRHLLASADLNQRRAKSRRLRARWGLHSTSTADEPRHEQQHQYQESAVHFFACFPPDRWDMRNAVSASASLSLKC
jgi:hypothetical protein